MQTAIAHLKIVDTTAPATHNQATPARLTASRLMKSLARKWDMIGVLAVMGSSAAYAVSHLMTLTQ